MDEVSALEIVHQPRHRLARRSDHCRYLFMRVIDLQSHSSAGAIARSRPLQKKSRELIGYRGRQSERAGLIKSSMVAMAQLFYGAESGLRVFVNEADKVCFPDKVHLAGFDDLGRCLVLAVGHYCAQPKNFSGLGNTKDNASPIAGI